MAGPPSPYRGDLRSRGSLLSPCPVPGAANTAGGDASAAHSGRGTEPAALAGVACVYRTAAVRRARAR
ncbi:hypothetical protein GCM10023224_36390 [Streptomonospora halophila]|uniref:Uncharacterized protein n=1 Tax=Streptomonospora halophila TaxID=427369 RepID=A0ABP9GNY1_9ACTN